MTIAASDEIWKALSDTTRRSILDLLRVRPRTTGDLAARFSITRFGVMKHLRALADAGLVIVERRGRERWNHLNPAPLQDVLERWIEPYEALWAERLLNLKRTAEIRTGGATAMAAKSEPGAPRAARIHQQVEIAAPRQVVFHALTQRIGDWWGPPYLANPETTDLTLDLRPGGALREIWPDGGGAVWGTIEILDAPRLIQFNSRAFMPGAVAGLVTFELAESGGVTRVTVDHRVIGMFEADRPAIHEGGWGDLLGRRLKAFVETGERLGVKAQQHIQGGAR